MSAQSPSVRVDPGVSSSAASSSASPVASNARTLKHYRIVVKRACLSMRWEMSMFVIVLIYFLVVFATFALSDMNVRPSTAAATLRPQRTRHRVGRVAPRASPGT